MRDVNPRPRERFDLSLDGRQIASVVVGALVVLALVFVLGLNVGKQIARTEARPEAAAGEDALAALDRPPAVAPAVRDESLTYHDRLVGERPSAPPAEPRPTPAPAPQAPATQAPPPAPPAATPAPSVAAAGPAPSASEIAVPEPASPAEPEAAPAPAGAWSVQVGAANDREEAERIAGKYARFRPRIEVAILQGKTWHRVRIGAFETKADAAKFLDDLARETGAKGFVTSSR